MVKKVLGSDHLSYELVQHMDDERFHLTWEIVPPISQDGFQGRGEFSIRTAPGGCIRKVTGEILIRIPIVGGRIERMLASEISKGHAANAKTATDWLSRLA